jgi:hypothetical protein
MELVFRQAGRLKATLYFTIFLNRHIKLQIIKFTFPNEVVFIIDLMLLHVDLMFSFLEITIEIFNLFGK